MTGSQRKKSLLLLGVSAGAGHLRAAEALEETARESRPAVDVVHVDVMELVPGLFRKLYADSYIKIVERHPALWGYLYDKTDREEGEDSKLRRLRLAFERLNTLKLRGLLARTQPDQVICTHFLPAGLLSRLADKGRFGSPVWVQFTDFDVHRLWIHAHVTGYFAASAEVAWRMRDRGVPADRIRPARRSATPITCWRTARP